MMTNKIGAWFEFEITDKFSSTFTVSVGGRISPSGGVYTVNINVYHNGVMTLENATRNPAFQWHNNTGLNIPSYNIGDKIRIEIVSYDDPDPMFYLRDIHSPQGVHQPSVLPDDPAKKFSEIVFSSGGQEPIPPPEPEPPPAPQNLVAELQDDKIILTWDEVIGHDVIEYKVYRNNIALAVVSSNTYTDTNIHAGSTYTYAVTAINQDKIESSKSNSVTVTVEIIEELSVNLIGNYDSIIVQVTGGTLPYQIFWNNESDIFSASQYVIRGLQPNTDYTVTVKDANDDSITKVVNTGSKKSFVPPTMPNPQSIFQQMLNNFGDAGKIALAVISAAVSLGVIVILGLWGWRLTKKWLATSK